MHTYPPGTTRPVRHDVIDLLHSCKPESARKLWILSEIGEDLHIDKCGSDRVGRNKDYERRKDEWGPSSFREVRYQRL